MNIWRKHRGVNKIRKKKVEGSGTLILRNTDEKTNFISVLLHQCPINIDNFLSMLVRKRLIFMLLISMFLISCNSVNPVVKVGLVAPFEGENRAIGYDAIYSARLAVREINEAGGIGGYRVALVALNDSGDTELAQENAQSLVVDSGVVAVIGHWLPETTAVSTPIYHAANLPLIATDVPLFLADDPAELPPEFQAAYEAVTPFEETAGEYAGSTYDAFQLLWQALEVAEQTEGTITREGVKMALNGLE